MIYAEIMFKTCQVQAWLNLWFKLYFSSKQFNCKTIKVCWGQRKSNLNLLKQETNLVKKNNSN